LFLVLTLASSYSNFTSQADFSLPLIWNDQTRWLINNGMFRGVPKSFDDKIASTGKSFWLSSGYLKERPRNPNQNFAYVALDDLTAVSERSKIHNGLNIYDGAVWSISSSLSGLNGIVDIYYKNTLYASTTGANEFVDGIVDIRSDGEFYYGPDQIIANSLEKIALPTNMSFVHLRDPRCCGVCCEFTYDKLVPGSYLYRMISPNYREEDPIGGPYTWNMKAYPAGPNQDISDRWNLAGELHWNDWKPLTEENAWAVMLAPMQTLFTKNCGHISKFNSFNDAPLELQFALSIMPALRALLSPLGAIYHCPRGASVIPADKDEKTLVNNEDNFSAYAALKATYFILDTFYGGGDQALDKYKSTIANLISGLEKWFKSYLMPAKIFDEQLINSGGHVSFFGTYDPASPPFDFTVNAQVYGLLVVGSKKFDSQYGAGASYNVWKSVKKYAGFYDNSVLKGIGYTVSQNFPSGSKVWVADSTFAAIAMCKLIGTEYINSGYVQYGNELIADANSMNNSIVQPSIVDNEGLWLGGGLRQVDGSYLYANSRFFITNGWYANPIGSTVATGWAILNKLQYNPFQLGGGFNTTFWKTQCSANKPDPQIMMSLAKYYDYKYVPN